MVPFRQVIPDPAVPEWTAEARDVQQLLQVLRARYSLAGARADDVRARRDVATMAMPSNVREVRLRAETSILL